VCCCAAELGSFATSFKEHGKTACHSICMRETVMPEFQSLMEVFGTVVST